MSFREIWNGPSFLERGDAARRMKLREEAGRKKRSGQTKEGDDRHEHFRKDWDADLWD